MSDERRRARWGRAFNSKGEERLVGPKESFTFRAGHWMNDLTGKPVNKETANDLAYIQQLHDRLLTTRTGDEVYH